MTADPIARLFGELAPTYDQVGVDLFVPVAERLVELVAPPAGARAVDLGCGRGAATIPLAEAVGPGGRVVAGDLSPAMVQAATAGTAHLPQVEVVELDASAPGLPAHAADVVVASLVIFFLPAPAEALPRWLDLLDSGGRLGITTFGPQDDTWRAVDALFDPYLPPTMLDARTSGARGPFASDAGVQQLMSASGAAAVRTVVEPLDVAFDDAAAWRAWTMSVGQRQMWGFVPEPERDALHARAAELLATATGADGRIHLRQDVRYTIADVS